MKPKEYLKSIGAIEVIKQGRLSRENKALCAKAAAEGTFIEGFSPESSAPASVKVVKPKRDVPREVGYSYIDVPYPKGVYKAMAGKVEHGMAEVCNNCRVSLVQCHCGSPTISTWKGTVAVTIVPTG